MKIRSMQEPFCSFDNIGEGCIIKKSQRCKFIILFSAMEDATATTACSVLLWSAVRLCLAYMCFNANGVRRMEDFKRIDEANEMHAVTGRWRLVIQIVSGKQSSLQTSI